MELVKTTTHIDCSILIKIIGKKCIDFAASIPKLINIEDYKQLVTDRYIAEAIRNINDVFNKQLVE